MVPSTGGPDLLLYLMAHPWLKSLRDKHQLPRKPCPNLHLPRALTIPQQGWQEASEPTPELIRSALLKHIRGSPGLNGWELVKPQGIRMGSPGIYRFLQLQPLETDDASNWKLCEAETSDSVNQHLSLTGSRGHHRAAPVGICDIDTNSEKPPRPETLD